MSESKSHKTSEIRINDLLGDITDTIKTYGPGSGYPEDRLDRELRLRLEIFTSRLLTDAALLVNDHYPTNVHGTMKPSRSELVNMVQDL